MKIDKNDKNTSNPVFESLYGLFGGIVLLVIAVLVCTLFLDMKIFP